MSQHRKLCLAHHARDGHPVSVAAQQFASEVVRRTYGKLEIVILQNDALNNVAEQLHHVIEGNVDMVLPPHDRFSSYSRKFACVGLPFVFEDYDHADRVLDGEFSDWAIPDLNDMGLAFLGNWEWGFRQVSNSQRPILRPEDMNGLKIRVPPILQNRAAIQAMGGEAIPIEFSCLSGAIRQGLVDGEENPISVIFALKLYESHQYVSMLSYNYGATVHVINKQTFDSLTHEQQQILAEESKKSGKLARSLMRLQEEQQIQELGTMGIRIDYPDKLPFKLAAKAAYKVLKAAYGVDVVNPFLEMVERARIVASKIGG